MFTEKLQNLENRVTSIAEKLDVLLIYLSKNRGIEGYKIEDYKLEDEYTCIYCERDKELPDGK